MLAAKIGLVALGTVAAGTTTYLLIRNADPMPDCTTIDLERTVNAEYNSKLGSAHKYLLASKTDVNKDWWKWSLRRWLKDSRDNSISLSTEFGKTKIKGGAEAASDAKPLEEVCDDIYKKEDTEITLEASGEEDNKKKLARDLFSYCSPMGGFPTTVSSAKEYHASRKSHSSKLVSTTGNDWFWTQKTREFYAKGDSDLNGHNFFKKLQGEEKKKEEGQRRSLSRLCEEAYKSDSNGTGTNEKPVSTEEEIIKYCSLKGS